MKEIQKILLEKINLSQKNSLEFNFGFSDALKCINNPHDNSSPTFFTQFHVQSSFASLVVTVRIYETQQTL